MTSRQLRRAEERRLRKLARKGLHQPAPAASSTDPGPVPVAYQPVPEQPAPGPTAPADIPVPPTTTQSARTRAEINRENARQSTGPKTNHGKATSSRNAFKHGFSAAFAVLPSEDQHAFEELLAALRAEHQPAGPPKTSWSNALPSTTGSASALSDSRMPPSPPGALPLSRKNPSPSTSAIRPQMIVPSPNASAISSSSKPPCSSNSAKLRRK